MPHVYRTCSTRQSSARCLHGGILIISSILCSYLLSLSFVPNMRYNTPLEHYCYISVERTTQRTELWLKCVYHVCTPSVGCRMANEVIVRSIWELVYTIYHRRPCMCMRRSRYVYEPSRASISTIQHHVKPLKDTRDVLAGITPWCVLYDTRYMPCHTRYTMIE